MTIKTQIQNCKEKIAIRELSYNLRLRNTNERITQYQNDLYEAYLRKDIEMMNAIRKEIQRKQLKTRKLIEDRQELRDLQNSLYI